MVLIELDINPNNILLSDIDCASPVVKLEDLGNRMRHGETLFTNLSNDPSVAGRFQQICRAPEVWRGLGCWPSSDIWSLGFTDCCQTLYLGTQLTGQLAHWLGRQSIFGIEDKVVEDDTESWCIAK